MFNNRNPEPKRPTNNLAISESDDTNPTLCYCQIAAVLLTVKKEGPNQGRQFYTCSSKGCDFFAWKDGAGNNNNNNNSFNNGGGGGGRGGGGIIGNTSGGGGSSGFGGGTSSSGFNRNSNEVTSVMCNCNKNAVAWVFFKVNLFT